MSILAQQIEQLRSRMQEIAQSEGRCVAELADALKQADENLQNEVAELVEEHMARRGAILEKLHALADRLGAFPRQTDELAKEERAPPRLLNLTVHGDRRNEILDREINNHLRHRRAS